MRTETLFSELSSAILYRSQSALRGTDDTCIPSAIYAWKIFDNQQMDHYGFLFQCGQE